MDKLTVFDDYSVGNVKVGPCNRASEGGYNNTGYCNDIIEISDTNDFSNPVEKHLTEYD